MNIAIVARLLAGFSLFFSLSLSIPLVVSMFETVEPSTTVPFAGAMVIGLVVSGLLRAASLGSSQELFRKEGLATVGLAWFLAGALAAVPFVWSGAIPSFIDAYFECISGLTTTGATVLGTNNVDIESLPASILLWRSMLQWLGGIGIILVFIVLLPSVGVTGSRLLSSEQIGMSDDAVRPRMTEQARRLFVLYAGLTLAATLSYWIAGLSAFDAVCHAFTTLATGGFSNHNVSVGGYQNLGVELVAITFMFLAGCNFLLILRTLSTDKRQLSSALHRREFRTYAIVTVVAALGITLSLWFWGQRVPDESLGIDKDYSNLGRCLRDGTFQAVSILTSTGFANANFELWPKPALYLILMSMVIGSCTGSTAGGFKILRAIICAKLAVYSLRHFVQPRTVQKIRVGDEVVPDRVVSAVLGLAVLWIATVAAGAFVLDLDPGLDMMSALTASVSMTGCIGPAFGEVVQTGKSSYELVGNIGLGPYAGYGQLYPATKVFMCVQMVLGRLEVLAPLALLTPGFWRR